MTPQYLQIFVIQMIDWNYSQNIQNIFCISKEFKSEFKLTKWKNKMHRKSVLKVYINVY